MRDAIAALLVIALAFGASTALAASMTLHVVVDPHDRASELRMFDGGYIERELHPKVPQGGASIEIELPSVPSTASLLVEWPPNHEAAFPIVLSGSFLGQKVEVHLLQRRSPVRPASRDVRSSCDRSAPQGISSVFEMLFTCKGYALALEEAGEKWDPDHRQALSGWLVANYRLATLSNRVSPYGLDPDLRSRLEDILAREGSGRWTPIRLADARVLIELEETRPVRMAGFVPILLGQGAIPAASAINSVALETLRTLNPAGPIDGITERLLVDNQIYLDSLQPQ